MAVPIQDLDIVVEQQYAVYFPKGCDHKSDLDHAQRDFAKGGFEFIAYITI